MKFRKKPVVIEAFKFEGDFIDSSSMPYVPYWAYQALDDGILSFEGRGDLFVNTLEGKMSVTPGDYVIRGVQGEIYPCKPDIFEATYEVVEEIKV